MSYNNIIVFFSLRKYEKWLQQCNYIKRRIENELVSSKKLRETMYIPRVKTKNDLRAQNDSVNRGLKRRIYDTEKMKYELEWQKSNVNYLVLCLFGDFFIFHNKCC